MSKQTAVEWLANELLHLDNEFDMNLIDKNEYQKRRKQIIEQAKEMEKEKMEDFFLMGILDSGEDGLGFNHYYNLTFKSE